MSMYTQNLQRKLELGPSKTGRQDFRKTTYTFIQAQKEFPLKCNAAIQDTLCAPPAPANDSDDNVLYRKILKAAFTGLEEHYRDITVGLEKFPDVINRCDTKQGASPLHYAAIKGHLYTVLFFMERGASWDSWDKGLTATPLICAAAHGHLEIVKALVKHKAGINAGLDSTTAESPLLWAVRLGHLETVNYLLKQGASQISAKMYTETPIHAAVVAGSPPILEALIKAKGKTDLRMDTQKNTPLHLAASGEYQNALKSCQVLIEKGSADTNVTNTLGQTPLHFAAGTSFDPDIISYLLRKGARLDVEDQEGRTPLFYVVTNDPQDYKIMEVLLEAKCNVNHRAKTGHTALHLAALKECAKSAELLLMYGADYSVKDDLGASALKTLLRKIPRTPAILQKVFDSAVTVTRYESEPNDSCKVKVDYRFVASVSASPKKAADEIRKISTDSPTSPQKVKIGKTRRATPYSAEDPVLISRPETGKVKCLIDEDLGTLLLHPVVHSFLVLKWQKARPIFIFILLFKALLVLLFSIYVVTPFWFKKVTIKKDPIIPDQPEVSSNTTEPPLNTTLTLSEMEDESPLTPNGKVSPESPEMDPAPVYFVAIYSIIVSLAIISALVEFLQLIRIRWSQWFSLEPFIFIIVVIIMIVYMQPNAWDKGSLPLHRSMAALGICLAWTDAWIYMGRFPGFGLSIRVFFKVFQNFAKFLAPHSCLFIGFLLAFTILFPENGEFFHPILTIPKMVRVIAGDITIVPEGGSNFNQTFPGSFKWTEAGFRASGAGCLTVYIYTAYVLMVSIVLSNLLIGLAVNDIQGIYKEAAKLRLTKQTILLNTLESNFSGKWARSWVPKRILSQYITLFPVAQGRNLVFRPYDIRDKRLDPELKQAFLELDGNTRADDEPSLKLSLERASSTDRVILDRINMLTEKLDHIIDTLERRSLSD